MTLSHCGACRSLHAQSVRALTARQNGDSAELFFAYSRAPGATCRASALSSWNRELAACNTLASQKTSAPKLPKSCLRLPISVVRLRALPFDPSAASCCLALRRKPPVSSKLRSRLPLSHVADGESDRKWPNQKPQSTSSAARTPPPSYYRARRRSRTPTSSALFD